MRCPQKTPGHVALLAFVLPVDNSSNFSSKMFIFMFVLNDYKQVFKLILIVILWELRYRTIYDVSIFDNSLRAINSNSLL